MRNRWPFIGALVFVVLGIPMIIFGDPETRMIGLMSVLFFGGCSLVWVAPMMRGRRPKGVRITSVGMERGFLIPISRAAQLVLLLAMAAITAGGILIALLGNPFVGLLCTIFVGAVAIGMVVRLRGDRGLAITPTRLVAIWSERAEVDWDDVAGIGLYEQSRLIVLGIDATDPERIRRRRGTWMTRFNRSLTAAHIVLPADHLAVDPGHVLETLVAYLEHPERRGAIGSEAELARITR